ncbi:GMC oxidoreductase [Kitasatospora sp. NPDC005856]|uniref:GMC oxidoreductase n=1 Tax=Kitasatospora sp. NPDC005856 TaxID=3154566 RepID=UPI0033CDB02F
MALPAPAHRRLRRRRDRGRPALQGRPLRPRGPARRPQARGRHRRRHRGDPGRRGRRLAARPRPGLGLPHRDPRGPLGRLRQDQAPRDDPRPAHRPRPRPGPRPRRAAHRREPHRAHPTAVGGAGHLMGTMRMGTGPGRSAVDPTGQSHAHRGVRVVGSSGFPISGTANPTLTLVALTLRTADTLATALS